MNALIVNMLVSLLRMALGGVVVWLIQVGALQPGHEAEFYAALATAIVGIASVVYTNIMRHRQLNTAAAMNPTSVDVVKAMVKSGVYADATSSPSAVPNVPTEAR